MSWRYGGGRRYGRDDDFDDDFDSEELDDFDSDMDGEDEDVTDEDEEDECTPEARAAKFKLPPGERPDLGANSTYGLALAVGVNSPKPKVASTTKFPDWFGKAQLYEFIETPSGIIRNLTGLVVHKPTDTIVGYMHGQLVKRRPGRVTDACDEVGRGELIDMISGLFTPDGMRLRRGPLREQAWGSSLDGEVVLYIQHIELEPAHRGKSVLAAVEPALSRYCAAQGVACIVAVPGHDDRIATAKPQPGEKRAKIRDSLAQLGLKLVGLTNFCARSLSDAPRMARIHECAGDLPLREWSKTVNAEEFPALLRTFVAADQAQWEKENKRLPASMATDFPLVSRTAEIDSAVQGLRERDTELLMGRKGDPTHFPLQALQLMLRKHKAAWAKDKKLGKGIRDISDLLDKFAMEEEAGYGASLLENAFPGMRGLDGVPAAHRDAAAAFLRDRLQL